MAEEVLVVEGLFDHQEAELVHGPEHISVGEGVGGVRVHREKDVRMRRTHGADALQVRIGLDLQLDPPVALRQEALDLIQQRLGRRSDPDADAALHPGLVRAEP